MRNGYRVIDTDCHQMEPVDIWAEYIDPEFADRAPTMQEIGNGRTIMVVENEPLAKQDGSYPMDAKEFLEATVRGMKRFERARATGFSPASRLDDMEEQGVDAQVIYPTVGGQLLGKPFRDPELLAACCRAYNDWSLEYCSIASEKLLMAAMLPVQSPALAIEEAHRASEKGASAFYIRPNPIDGRNYYHEDLDPLWATLAELGKPICIHDSGSPHLPSFGDRMHTHTSGHIIAHPFEAMVAMMTLIWYGIIEKYPALGSLASSSLNQLNTNRRCDRSACSPSSSSLTKTKHWPSGEMSYSRAVPSPLVGNSKSAVGRPITGAAALRSMTTPMRSSSCL